MKFSIVISHILFFSKLNLVTFVCKRTQHFGALALPFSSVTDAPKNLIGFQVRKLRLKKGWSQDRLAMKLQLRGWSISRDSLASLESLRRRVPDCELLYLARVLGVRLEELFPRSLVLNKVGAQFQAGGKFLVSPTRAEK
ncbi:MAG: helix-turn-helix domain-containing protein [Limisphaerales bacterium]